MDINELNDIKAMVDKDLLTHMLDMMFRVDILQRDLVIIKTHTVVGRKERLIFCQAQPQPQLQLSWAEIALISSKTPTPPTHPDKYHRPVLKALLGTIWYYWVLLSNFGYYWVLLGTERFDKS